MFSSEESGEDERMLVVSLAGDMMRSEERLTIRFMIQADGGFRLQLVNQFPPLLYVTDRHFHVVCYFRCWNRYRFPDD